MEYKHISEIDFKSNVNDTVYGIFLAKNVEVRDQKDGKKFINITMVDRGYEDNVKVFNATEEQIQLMKSGKVYNAAIQIKPYSSGKNGLGYNLYNFELSNEPKENFVNWADGMKESFDYIQSKLYDILKESYGKIIYNIVIDNWDKFSKWVAASGQHHNMLGGLMVHTVEVMEQCELLINFWNKKKGMSLDLNLTIGAALIHDIAKTIELNVDLDTGDTEYSSLSALETHITMCNTMIDIEAYKLGYGYKTDDKSEEQLDLEKEKLALLKHLVLSHHGKKEWGSPIEASIPEAYILNKADEISAEIFRFNRDYKDMEKGAVKKLWNDKSVVRYKRKY